jgi:hypothetical protein
MYLSNGEPEFYKGKYKLFDSSGKEIEVVQWKVLD